MLTKKILDRTVRRLFVVGRIQIAAKHFDAHDWLFFIKSALSEVQPRLGWEDSPERKIKMLLEICQSRHGFTPAIDFSGLDPRADYFHVAALPGTEKWLEPPEILLTIDGQWILWLWVETDPRSWVLRPLSEPELLSLLVANPRLGDKIVEGLEHIMTRSEEVLQGVVYDLHRAGQFCANLRQSISWPKEAEELEGKSGS